MLQMLTKRIEKKLDGIYKSYFKHFLAATPYKRAAVRPPASH